MQVDGDGKFQRVSGTNVGGGTYWGLGRLLTKCKRYPYLSFFYRIWYFLFLVHGCFEVLMHILNFDAVLMSC